MLEVARSSMMNTATDKEERSKQRTTPELKGKEGWKEAEYIYRAGT
jgi:hypothetical protein